jgi:rare lipoprotein A
MGQQSARIGLVARFGALVIFSLFLASCSSGERARNTTYSPKIIEDGDPIPRGGGSYKVGRPYTINSKMYYPEENPGYRVEGIASWYGQGFHGRRTANGEVYDMNAISAAHPTLPMPSYVRVTNLENGKSLIVRVNDRGPYAKDRVIDLSTGAAKALGTYGQGLARVRVEYVRRASVAGSDDGALLATLREGTPAPPPSNTRVAAGNRPTQIAPTGAWVTSRAKTRSAAPEYVTAAPPMARPTDPSALGLMSGRGLY